MIFFLTLFEFANKVSSSSTQCIDPNCIECEDNQVECLRCSNSETSSYDLVNGKCLAIPCEIFGCSACGSSGCDVCSLGFYMPYGQTYCLQECGEYCLECSEFTCSSCVNGFDLYRGDCRMCEEVCKACSDSSNCECHATCADNSLLWTLIIVLVVVISFIWVICW